MSMTTDPLHILPSEVVLRILDFTSTADLACLTRLNRPWHLFIDQDHQDVIYGPKASHPPGAKDFTFLNDSQTFSKYYTSTQSWKDLCKRQTLLSQNWNSPHPISRESTIQIGDHPIWRFKPDFQRRLILSTSQAGGLTVTDMDSGELLHHLSREVVRPFAHLEYQDGTAVFDREGNAVEVWRMEDDSTADTRGVLQRVAVLPHEQTTRGFQLSFDTLCVVSSEGQGFVYTNMTTGEPRLQTQMAIEEGATGHLHQCADAVAWSQGTKGYHFYDKASGQCLGVLQPAFCNASSNGEDNSHFFHMKHEDQYPSGFRLGEGSLTGHHHAYPPHHPRRDRTSPMSIHPGPMPEPNEDSIPLPEDEWGAGMFEGDVFVGISRAGRVFVCSNWRAALLSSTAFALHTCIVECDSDGSTFDLGGWLSIRDQRVMFEIQDRIYVLGLNNHNRVIPSTAAAAAAAANPPPRPSFSFSSCLSQQLAVPVSFMALYEDCIMTTYTTLRQRDRSIFQLAGRGRGVIPTKVIRILSFAPDLDGNDDDGIFERQQQQQEQQQGRASADTGQSYENLLREDLFQLVQMLADEEEDEEGDVEAVLDLQQEDEDELAYEDLEELD